MAKRRKIFNTSQFPDSLSSGVDRFISLLDTPTSYVGEAGKSVRVKTTEDGLEFYVPTESSGNTTTFLGLTDTPSAYTGNASRLIRVNATENALEYDPNTYVIQSRTINTNNGLTGGGDLSANRTIGLTGQALTLHNLSTTGYITRTGANTFATRTFAGGTGISLTNGDGIAGNTTISLNATLGNLSDVTLTSLVSNQTIYYNGTAWVNGAYTTGTVTSVATGTGLTGGTITTTGTIALTGQVLSFHNLSTNGLVYRNGTTIGTRTITGSTFITITNGDGVAGNPTISLGSLGLGNLSNVVLTTSTSGQVLTFNGTNWVNAAVSGTGTVTEVATGTGLTGGPITSSGTIALTGQALSFHNLVTNGIVYKNGTTIGARTITGSTYITVTNGDGNAGNPTISLGTLNIGNLSNVVLTTPTSGEVLSFNGTNWVNAAVGGSGTVTSVGTGTGLTGGPITTSGTISVVFGTTTGTVAEGSDSRFHAAVTIGTANGLSLSGQAISLAIATTTVSGAMSATDKTKLDGLNNYTHPAKTWVDKTTLSGATVISNLTIDSLGHPTNWTTRNLTPADIGAQPAGTYDNYQSWNLRTNGVQRIGIVSGGILDIVAGTNTTVSYSAGGVVTISSTDTNTVYTHPTYTAISQTLSGATVVASFSTDTIGSVTGFTTRTLTTTDIGAEPAFSKGDLVASTGISFTGTATGRLVNTGDLSITNTDRGSSQNIFKNINNGAGAWQFGAGSNNDSLSFAAAGATSVSFDATNKRITFSSTDTNTTYSAGTGLSLSGTTFSHTDTSELLGTYGDDGIKLGWAIGGVVLDTFGHVTGIVARDLNNHFYLASNPNGYTSNSGTVTSVATGTGLTGGTITTTGTISLTGQALALHNLAANGFIVRNGAGTVINRALGAGTGITISNTDGVSGNPSIALNTTYSDDRYVLKAGDTMSGSLGIGQGSGAAETLLNIGQNKTVDSPSYIDFQSQAGTGIDYNFRILKNSGSSGIAEIRNGGGSMQFINEAATTMLFATSNVGRMYINANGNIGMGTSNPDSIMAGVKGLAISDSGSSGVSLANGAAYWLMYNAAGDNTIRWYYNGLGDRMILNSAGDLSVIGDVITFSSSDERLKDNIVPINNPLGKIEKIGGYSFDWNKKQTAHTGADYGVLAQEIAEILPEAVTTRDNGYLAVKYEKLIPLLIESIKELNKEIKLLKNK